MAYDRATDRSDRAKALAGVLLVHLALGALILSGLNVRSVGEAVQRLKTFDIRETPPPRVEPPPPQPEVSGAPEEEAAPANIQSRPTPVVAPPPQVSLPVPLPMNVAQTPGPEGADRTAGASNLPGAGTGAGGQGSGFGGGGGGGTGTGAGRGDGRTPARLLNKIPDREYRRISGRRMPRGSAAITVKVGPDGAASNCRVARSSGDPQVDAAVCAAATRFLRFRPALDAAGRPIAQDITYTPTWRPN